MGGLIYEPDLSEVASYDDKINLDRPAVETQEVLEGESSEVFAESLGLSG